MSNGYQSREWIPWYCDDAASWVELSLAARGCAEGIARKMGRKRSELPLGSRGLRAIAAMLQRPWDEIEPALQELLAKGPNGEPARLEHDAERNVLIDGQAAERQRAVKSTDRASKSKKAAANTNDAPESVGNVANVPVGTGSAGNAPSLSPLFSSSGEDQDPPSSSPMPPTPPPRWHLDSLIPEAWAKDARVQAESRGKQDRVDVSTEWSLYLADRMRPDQPKKIGLADWRGWVIRACTTFAGRGSGARGAPREQPGGASARARVLLTGSDD